MEKNDKRDLFGIIAVIAVFIFSSVFGTFLLYGEDSFIASIQRAFPEKITPESLKASYNEKPIRILLVPGHDNKDYGSGNGGIREADISLETAKYISEYFKYNPKFTVFTTRDFSTGEYTDVFSKYFETEKDSIKSYMDEKTKIMDEYVDAGAIEKRSTTSHAKAPSKARENLYAINKWTNENNIDIALHIHFNDYPGRKWNSTGKYNGFSIYIPESQLPNARVSRVIGEKILSELDYMFPKSDLPMEEETLIETQELIAVGSKGSRDGASVLVEFGYIYEPQFNDDNIRPIVLKEMAYRTHKAVVSYFDENAGNALPQSTLIAPFPVDIFSLRQERGENILKLQASLLSLGFYPPVPKTKNDCPVNGIFGNCTRTAIDNLNLFQSSKIQQFSASIVQGL